MKIKLGIIGTSGYWGRKILKAINSLPFFELVICAGYSSKANLTKAIKTNFFGFPEPIETLRIEDVFQSNLVDAVIISTPAETHYSIARECLENGKHVFLEKPMCLNSKDAKELVQLSETNEKILFIDHTYLHNKCLPFIKNKLENKELGKIFSYSTIRTQMGIYRNHNVLWDLAPHDLSIIKFLFPDENLKGISVTDLSTFHLNRDKSFQKTEDTIFFKLSYESGLSVHAFLSWCNPKRRRDIVITGENKMLLFENNSRVIVFEHNLSYKNHQEEIQWFLVEEYLPNDDPLRNSLQCFYNCIIQRKDTIDGFLSPQFGYDIIVFLERIQQSLICSKQFQNRT